MREHFGSFFRLSLGITGSAIWLLSFSLSSSWAEDAAQTNGGNAAEFVPRIRPLLQEYCLKCHSTEKPKGDLDLERFTSFSEVMKHPKVWERVVEQLTLGEMPPKAKPQPTPAERERLLAWVNRALDEAALAQAGDPGPVVLRRLNNAEYNYTVRDLTGVTSLNPTKEFPADSAAGEGFMNTGNALVMSPSLITKYLDAGKDVASHAVLLPTGLRFAAGTTRRDWTEEILAAIRAFYATYTEVGGTETVTQQGMELDKNRGGRLPLEKYLAATLELRQDVSQLPTLAHQRGLSAKYLAGLWEVLNRKEPSLVLDPLRTRWRSAQLADIPSLVADIAQWQQVLWKFSSVGHIGKLGGPKAWMEPVSPLSSKQEVHLKLEAPTNGNEVVVYLVARDAGDGNANDFVVWQQPKLVVPGQPELPLRDARDFLRELTTRRTKIFAATAKCLDAVAEVSTSTNRLNVPSLARRYGVDAEALSAWLEYLGVGDNFPPKLDYFTNQLHQSSGYEFVNGWGSSDTPLLLANASGMPVRIPGNLKPHGVTVHPSPRLNAGVGWRSPLDGPVRISARVTHAHPECGNGVEWSLELRRGNTRQRLATGTTQGGKEVKVGPVEELAVRTGDLISLLIGPREGNHSCDLTDIELVITSPGPGGREWNLTQDVSPDVLAGNPHADRFGNLAVWHFYTEPVSGREIGPVIPAGSALAKWQSATRAEEKHQFAQAVQTLLTSGPPPAKDSPDAKLKLQLTSLSGPLFTRANSNSRSPENSSQKRRRERPMPSGAPAWGIDPAAFGKHPNGTAIDANSLCVQAPAVLEIHLPADLAAGAEFVTTGILEPKAGTEGSVQLQALTSKPTETKTLLPGAARSQTSKGTWTDPDKPIIHSTPIVIVEGSAASKRIESNLAEFRQWFPAALCYTKIVPVDEVVTLTLLYREDEPLTRLMLDEAQKAQLDQLWDELHYVSQDALTLVDAFEQLWQYATQDADPKVFEPMRKPINDRAAAFRQQLTNSQPQHLEGVLEFAGRAYRRPLTGDEKEELRGLYRKLRAEELPHDEAIRLTLARIFVAPAYLYRLEQPPAGSAPAPVSDWELASRLSYFLWSSLPDPELRTLAAAGKLHDPATLAAQARRMLPDPRLRRLATEFACAWLHIHDFESLDEKSEKHFPTFARLRGPMYEEAIRFFTDAFQKDAPVLELFDTDHTFLNEGLAEHYGIPGVTGTEWRRVDGVKQFGRGGILGLGATLAKQSGASRTSPILRGNWVAEVILGDKSPRPPKDVPRLPEDEATESLTVRQLTEKHTSDPRCAGCHARIDGYGYALEGFDTIGRARTRDLGDRPIDTHTKLFDGTQVDGAAGLREYLLTEKREVVLRQFCRKLLGYALGRSVMLADKPLVTEMQRQLAAHNYRFSAAVATIVRSQQFREIRGRDTVVEE